MKYIVPALVAVLALGWLAGPSEARMRMQAMSPEAFAKKVAVINDFEIKAAHLALDKSKNDGIVKFAHRMIDDHTKLADDLKATLKQANLPEVSNQLDERHQAALTKLQGEKEAAFDRTYAAGMRTGHMQAVQLLENYAKSGSNAQLKQYAANGLPIIKEHLKLAEALRPGRNLSARR